ncbi:YraN family protein [candidate division KSB1 bacterium]|nr:YraN family protein [candidate division KSB1 bacterium]
MKQQSKPGKPYGKFKKKKFSVGKEGEKIALDFLEKKGYEIIETNYRFGRGEIDIIVRKGDLLVFVEVKTQKHGDFGDPINWINRRKQRQIGTIAKGYLYENNIMDMDCQFDVITLKYEEGAYQINHIENAFWL